MKISIIIPTYNEEKTIAATIGALMQNSSQSAVSEIIIVDAGSEDKTAEKVKATSARFLTSPQKGRAAQMNYGAKAAKSDILYFLHADTLPPENFAQKILESVRNGVEAGCFRLSFDEDHFLLKFYAWCTRFDIDAFRFGDQSLFVMKSIFDSLGGFREDHIVMEDQEMVKRIKGAASFRVLSDEVMTSARKYLENGVLKLQIIFTLIFMLYKAGVSQSKLVLIYKKLIH